MLKMSYAVKIDSKTSEFRKIKILWHTRLEIKSKIHIYSLQTIKWHLLLIYCRNLQISYSISFLQNIKKLTVCKVKTKETFYFLMLVHVL